jgi:hypothetical protein
MNADGCILLVNSRKYAVVCLIWLASGGALSTMVAVMDRYDSANCSG